MDRRGRRPRRTGSAGGAGIMGESRERGERRHRGPRADRRECGERAARRARGARLGRRRRGERVGRGGARRRGQGQTWCRQWARAQWAPCHGPGSRRQRLHLADARCACDRRHGNGACQGEGPSGIGRAHGLL